MTATKYLPSNIYNEDCLKAMLDIPDKSVDTICIDPPYLYLKKQRLERPFDEQFFFTQCKRILKDTGFIILFGRGTSFYRWNMILAGLGLEFKEEIIWDKSYVTSPVTPISRVHESISIHGMKSASINMVRVPYTEMKEDDLPSILQDIKRIKSALNNTDSLDALILYCETKEVHYKETGQRKFHATVQKDIKEQDRAVKTFQSICYGLKEKSIIRVKRDHYDTIHPTQKPVRLLERLLSLTTKQGDIVVDFFSGSGSTDEACENIGRSCISFEIDKEYFNLSIERKNKRNPLGLKTA